MYKTVTISLHLQRLEQLLIAPGSGFNPHYVLTSEAEEFIIEEGKTTSYHCPINLDLYLPPDVTRQGPEIATAIHQHFGFLKLRSERKLKQALQLAWKALLVAIVFLSLLVSLTLVILRFVPQGGVSITFREILIILGWVALWRPADLLLYEWRTIKREVNLLRRLEKCKVDIYPTKE